jgi:hypothetical protein
MGEDEYRTGEIRAEESGRSDLGFLLGALLFAITIGVVTGFLYGANARMDAMGQDAGATGMQGERSR